MLNVELLGLAGRERVGGPKFEVSGTSNTELRIAVFSQVSRI